VGKWSQREELLKTREKTEKELQFSPFLPVSCGVSSRSHASMLFLDNLSLFFGTRP
jgi:hypothetical protein